jgi:exo-beta-1,3-glucanase (GH17 family)
MPPPSNYRTVKIFISSPGDVREERDLAASVVRDLNRVVGPRLGLTITAMLWEDTIPDMGPSQDVINTQHSDYDIFVGIMWARFGTPTPRFGSGTEEEFRTAYGRWASTGSPRILFYVCVRDIPFPRDEETIDQLMQAVHFRRDLLGKGLISNYSTPTHLRTLLWEHLFQVLCDWPGAQKLSTSDLRNEGRETPALRQFHRKLDSLTWICYSPTEFDPDLGRYPTLNAIEDDLRTLAQGPFNGVITFGSEHSLSMIPKAAKACGIPGVVMGVFRPDNRGELEAAIACKEYVDGYCIGHLGLNRYYDVDQLCQALDLVREATGRPVTTTERIADYLQNSPVLDVIDWILPDVHSYWHQGALPDEAVDEFILLASAVQQLNTSGKRVLLNMVSFPSDGGPGLSEENQTSFFRGVRTRLYNHVSLSNKTRCAFSLAFDNLWKTVDRGWSPAEKSTGLYSASRVPKDAVKVFSEELRSL